MFIAAAFFHGSSMQSLTTQINTAEGRSIHANTSLSSSALRRLLRGAPAKSSTALSYALRAMSKAVSDIARLRSAPVRAKRTSPGRSAPPLPSVRFVCSRPLPRILAMFEFVMKIWDIIYDRK